MIFDARHCQLGEGPLWHPARQELFWFDILANTMRTPNCEWQFDQPVSAAGWVDDQTLIVASATGLLRFDIESGHHEQICPLEQDNPVTRSNDGRADPWGGFWIGTMGRRAESRAGAIYRYYRGELRQLYPEISISNAICFSPNRRFAYFTDTPTKQIMRQELSPDDGWPAGDPQVWLDVSDRGWHPDGAVVDRVGNVWIAKWGGAGIACFSASAELLSETDMPALQVTCPAFGGADLTTLFATSATMGLTADKLEQNPHNGKTFAVAAVGQGQAEHKVIL